MKTLLTGVFATMLVIGPAASAQTPLDRGIRNYLAVMQGRQQLHELSPAEQAEVAEVDRLLRARRSEPASPADQCVKNELRRRGGNPSALERRLIDLQCSRR